MILNFTMQGKQTTTLFRPVNQKELDSIEASGWSVFPPRLPEQPIFYPVMNEAYATQISKEWNVPAYGVGYVVKFEVETDYLKEYRVENVGGDIHNELWVPAEALGEFNRHIIGPIKLIGKYN